jgi:predicted nucleic acid-binding Zn ribbon protein
MPIYEYQCKKCKEKFEVQQSMKDKSFKHHYDIGKPGTTINCNGEVERIISNNINVIFRGSGWTHKFHTRTGKNQSRLNAALNKLNVEDDSNGWSNKEDE